MISDVEKRKTNSQTRKEKTKKSKSQKNISVRKPYSTPSQYLKRLAQLNNKKKFTFFEFQEARTVSCRKDILDSFQEIGTILDDRVMPISRKEIGKVCFIVANSCSHSLDYRGIGPFNDAYLIGKFHHDQNYEVFLLYNSTREVFLRILEFFLKYTTKYLTIYYTGTDSIKIGNHGLRFIDNTNLFDDDLAKFICDKCNGKSKILILSDCSSGGGILRMNAVKYKNETQTDKTTKIIAFSVHKTKLKKDIKSLSRGLFTYYFCKLVKENPRCSACELVDLLNTSLHNFRESVSVECSDEYLPERVLFKDAIRAFPMEEEETIVADNYSGDFKFLE